MSRLTRAADEVPPHLRELIKHEKHPEEPRHPDFSRYSRNLGVRLRNNGEIGTFSAPHGPTP